MGLDMYLTRKTYVKNWDYMKPEQKHTITVKLGGKEREDIKPERISHIIEDVAYWRKANAIHKWFVDNCQGGTDDCRESYVSRDQLTALVQLCKQVLETVETTDGQLDAGTTYHGDGRVEKHTVPGKVIAQQELAAQLLPTARGFFFGSTNYDEYYLDDVRSTLEQLEPLLADAEGEFYYHSSW